MINKLKIFFLMILCFVAVGAATEIDAQGGNDKILAPGAQPLRQSEVNKLIEFYEWAFETEFSAGERAKFAELSVAAYREDAATSRKNINVLIKGLANVRAKDEGAQAQVRQNFNESFIKDLRASDDEVSQLLLGVYERGGGATQGKAETDDAGGTTQNNDGYETVRKSGAGTLSSIVGKWVSGNTGSMTKTTSGVYLGGNASRHTYQFGANGAVEYTGIMNMMAGGCRMQIFKTMKGRAVLSGDRLTINWSPASFSREDSCSPSKNYKKTLPAETETFQVFFENYYDDKQLCLKGEDKTCFSLDK